MGSSWSLGDKCCYSWKWKGDWNWRGSHWSYSYWLLEKQRCLTERKSERETFSTLDLWLQNLLSRDFKADFYAWNDTKNGEGSNRRVMREWWNMLSFHKMVWFICCLSLKCLIVSFCVFFGACRRNKPNNVAHLLYLQRMGGTAGGKKLQKQVNRKWKGGQRICDGVWYTISSKKMSLLGGLEITLTTVSISIC